MLRGSGARPENRLPCRLFAGVSAAFSNAWSARPAAPVAWPDPTAKCYCVSEMQLSISLAENKFTFAKGDHIEVLGSRVRVGATDDWLFWLYWPSKIDSSFHRLLLPATARTGTRRHSLDRNQPCLTVVLLPLYGTRILGPCSPTGSRHH
jgi:hypothetical protein